MKHFLAAMILLMTLVVVSTAQNLDGKAAPMQATENKLEPVRITLSAEDQKQLDLITDNLAKMKPQLEVARKQQEDAQSRLNEANNFISQYNTIDAARMAFLFRIAADVCGCKTTDLEFSADGKSVVRKTATDAKAKP